MGKTDDGRRVPREACMTFEEAMAAYGIGSRHTIMEHVGDDLSVVKFEGDKRHYLIREELEAVFGGGRIIKPARQA